MSELFDIPESLSPRLKWMRDHAIEVTPFAIGGWIAKASDADLDDPRTFALGDDPDSAIADLARKLNLPTWH